MCVWDGGGGGGGGGEVCFFLAFFLYVFCLFVLSSSRFLKVRLYLDDQL